MHFLFHHGQLPFWIWLPLSLPPISVSSLEMDLLKTERGRTKQREHSEVRVHSQISAEGMTKAWAVSAIHVFPKSGRNRGACGISISTLARKQGPETDPPIGNVGSLTTRLSVHSCLLPFYSGANKSRDSSGNFRGPQLRTEWAHLLRGL